MKEKVKEKNEQMKSEGYLKEIFSVVRKAEGLSVTDKKTRFNGTEIRLLGEILNAKYQGKRMISTQLAKSIGVTRSAISQIVNRLEAQGVVKRVADEVDRKIAYVELTETALEIYNNDLKMHVEFIGKAVEEYGVERFHTMCALLDEFCNIVEAKKAQEMSEKRV